MTNTGLIVDGCFERGLPDGLSRKGASVATELGRCQNRQPSRAVRRPKTTAQAGYVHVLLLVHPHSNLSAESPQRQCRNILIYG